MPGSEPFQSTSSRYDTSLYDTSLYVLPYGTSLYVLPYDTSLFVLQYDTSLYVSSVRHVPVHSSVRHVPVRFFPSMLTCAVHSVADPRCLSQIPDPNFSYPGSRAKKIPESRDSSRIRIKEVKYF
jgi:hypothetical protein